jgi:hypothetical protein
VEAADPFLRTTGLLQGSGAAALVAHGDCRGRTTHQDKLTFKADQCYSFFCNKKQINFVFASV